MDDIVKNIFCMVGRQKQILHFAIWRKVRKEYLRTSRICGSLSGSFGLLSETSSGLVWFLMTWIVLWVPRVIGQCERLWRENMPSWIDLLFHDFGPWDMRRDEIINSRLATPPNPSLPCQKFIWFSDDTNPLWVDYGSKWEKCNVWISKWAGISKWANY